MMTAETYLKSIYHRFNNGIQGVRKSLNPAKFYAGRIINQIKSDEKISFKETPNIVVEINNTCNLNCVMCETRSAKRTRGSMSPDDFVRVLDEIIKPKGQKVLVVHTVGEPLIHPDFDRIAEEVYKRNIRLLLTTNGLSLKRHGSIFEKYPGLFAGVNISVDGASRETYDKIRIGGRFDSLIDNLAWLSDVNSRLKLKIPIGIQCVLSMDNLHEIPAYFKVYTKYVQPEHISFNMVSNLSASTGKVGDSTLREGYYFSKNILESESVQNAPCLLPFIQMHVLFDGCISACCRDYHGELIMGDIKKDGWQEVWTGERYENMRKLHHLKKTDNFPMCKSCYIVPSAFTFALNNFVQYLVHTGRIEEGDIGGKIVSLFKKFSELYHKKDFNLNRLAGILESA